MKIEPGFYRTRNGSRARVLCTDAPGDYPVVGYVEKGDGSTVTFEWSEEGNWALSSCRNGRDLIEPWKDEPEPEKPIEVTLSQVREAAQLVARRVDAGLDADIDDCLARAGISAPRPPAKQPVRVSGWVVAKTNGEIWASWFETEAEALYHARLIDKVIYVTGTEGVGPDQLGVGPDVSPGRDGGEG